MKCGLEQNEKLPYVLVKWEITVIKKKKFLKAPTLAIQKFIFGGKKKSVEVPKKPMKFVERHLNKNIHMITDCSRSEKRWIASNQNRSIYKMGIIKLLRAGGVFCLRETCFSWLTRHLYFPLESADFRMVVLVAEIHTLHRSSILPR